MVGLLTAQVLLFINALTIRKIAFLLVGNTIGLDSTSPEVVSLAFIGGNRALVPVFPAESVVK